MWLLSAADSAAAFHLVLLGNNMLTEVRQGRTQETHGRRGRSAHAVWANRRLLLRADETRSDGGSNRLNQVFDLDHPTGKLHTAWNAKEQLRALLRTGLLQDASAAEVRLRELIDHPAPARDE
jgi:hypothetical protein